MAEQPKRITRLSGSRLNEFLQDAGDQGFAPLSS